MARHWRPARPGPRLRKPLRVIRNGWLLRRELLAKLLRRQPKPPKATPVRCIRCGHDLSKPCRPGSPTHVIRWPESVPSSEFRPGQLVYVRRQKARAGLFRPDYELRARPW